MKGQSRHTVKRTVTKSVMEVAIDLSMNAAVAIPLSLRITVKH